MESKYFFVKFFPKYPAVIAPIILKRPITAIEKAPKVEVEFTPKDLIRLLGGIAAQDSVIKAGKWAVIKPSWKPQEKKPKNNIEKVGSLMALNKTSDRFSLISILFTLYSGLMAIRQINVAKTIIANITMTDDQVIVLRRALVKGGPNTCPAEPAAVVIPRTRERFSGVADLPTTAKIGPKPVPAIPHPIIMFSIWWASGVTALLLIKRPTEYKITPNDIAFLSPNFSANAPKNGVDIPHAKFCIAIAIENSALGHKKSSAIGIWNNPNDDLIAKLISKIRLPPINTGVKIEFFVCIKSLEIRFYIHIIMSI